MAEQEEPEQEAAFYMEHKDEFHEKYYDKWLVIAGESLEGVFDMFADAAKFAVQRFVPGKFMIHKPAQDGTVIKIGSFIDCVYPDEDEIPIPTITACEGEPITYTYAH